MQSRTNVLSATICEISLRMGTRRPSCRSAPTVARPDSDSGMNAKMISPSRHIVIASPKKNQRNENSARMPPIGGAIANPRFSEMYIRANAWGRFNTGTRSAIMADAAGRYMSVTKANTPTAEMKAQRFSTAPTTHSKRAPRSTKATSPRTDPSDRRAVRPATSRTSTRILTFPESRKRTRPRNQAPHLHRWSGKRLRTIPLG